MITRSSLKEKANARRRKKQLAEWAYENLGWQVILINHTVIFQDNRAGFKLVRDCQVARAMRIDCRTTRRFPQGLFEYELPPALYFRNLEVLNILVFYRRGKGGSS